MRPLLAVDWGTSTLRGALLDDQGLAREERSFPRGILGVPAGAFPSVFEECFGDWMRLPGTLCLMSGMIGSRQGWREAPYCPCPAGYAEIAGQLSWIEPGRIALVPGLSCERAGLSGHPVLGSVPDVMRGEETQILGALRLLGLRDATMVLPGTHSKWVQVRDERIISFTTFMTGEFFALLRQHSILARSLPTDGPSSDEEAFLDGVRLALRGPSLLGTAFTARTLALFERMGSERLGDYLSGLVIGEELRAQSLAPQAQVLLIGAKALTRRYQQALALLQVSAECVGAAATWAGLHAIARTIDTRHEQP